MLSRTPTKVIFLLLMAAIIAVPTASAQASYKFTQLSIPGSISATAYGVNDFGTIVGSYTDSTGIVHGFQLIGSTLTTIDDPNGNGASTVCYSVGQNGVIVGAYSSGAFSNGFMYKNGVFTDIIPPGSVGTTAYGINDAGSIVGTYLNGASQLGFLYDGSAYTDLIVPGMVTTLAIGINSSGLITLEAADASGSLTSWEYNGTSYTQLNVPGANITAVHFINDRGEIAFAWFDSLGAEHGAIYANGIYYLTDDPAGTNTGIYTINDGNEIVGRYLPTGATLYQPFKGLNTPSITLFSPTSGPVGTVVSIRGSGFTQTTSVTFNGKTATFKVVSDSKVTAAVPKTATTGKIKLTTPAGVAFSKTNFVVH
jgi:hypothetical protein